MSSSHRYGVSLVCGMLVLFTAYAGRSQSEKKLHLNLDYGVFNFGTQTPYLELYYALNKNGLNFMKNKAGQLEAQAILELTIYKDNRLYANKMWRMKSSMLDSANRKSDKMVDQVRYQIDPGRYRVKIAAKDVNRPGNRDSIEVEVNVKPASQNQFSLSNIQLASSITKASLGQNDIFCKNTLRIIPNPDAFYGSKRPLLYYYLESYHLDKVFAGPTYRTKCLIADANGKPVSEIKPRIRTKRIMPSSVEVGNMNVSSLPSGTYFLIFSVLNAKGEEIGTTSKKFYIYNPNIDNQFMVSRDASDPLYQYFQALDGASLEREYELASYIVRDEDRKIWHNITSIEGKRQFLAAFWRARDPDPETPENEMRQEYFKRMKEANQKFRSYNREGWRTDRGRVYILYGPPDYIDRFPSTESTKPYEIWNYNYIPGQGKGEFIFADMEGLREFQLIHATPTGEVKNEDWKRYISVVR